MKPDYKDFKCWAKVKMKEWLDSDYVNNLTLGFVLLQMGNLILLDILI